MDKVNSLTKKFKTIKNGGLENIKAIYEGGRNYNNPNQDIENLAKERISICIGCKCYVQESNKLLTVDDSNILEADEMMCNECGCALPYKIRQSIKKCKKWKK